MSMIQGLVVVDDDGNETFTPNDATNATKVVYLALMAANSTVKVKSKQSGGGATWTPPKPSVSNPPTSNERVAIAAWQQSHPVMTPPPPAVTVDVVHTIKPDPATKQKTAEMATAVSSLIPYILANATISTVIPASSAGDGLQTSAAAGSPTTHPSSAKTLTGTIT